MPINLPGDQSSGLGNLNPQTLTAATGASYNQAALAAQTAYNNAKLQGDADQLAFAKAQQAFNQATTYAQTYGTSPGGTYNGMQLPPAGTPTMAQAGQWVSEFGNVAAPSGNELSLAAQHQYLTDAMAKQQNMAALSGTYTPPTGGTVGSSMNWDAFDRAMQNTLGSQYNQNAARNMWQNLAGGGTPSADQISSIVQSASGGRLTGLADIAGQLPQGAYRPPQDALTLAAQQQYGAMYGYAGAPLPGQMTQSMQEQQQQDAINRANVTGMYYGPSNVPQAQAGTVSWDQISGQLQAAAGANYNDAAAKAAYQNAIGYNAQQGGFQGNQAAPLTQAQMQTIFNAGGLPASQYGQGAAPGGQGPGGQVTLAAQNQYWNQSMDYLKMLASMQGPADYGSYLRTLGSTPGGMQGLVGAVAGQYMPGGGTTGYPTQVQSPQNLVQAATSGISPGYGYMAGQPAGGQAPTAGQQMQTGQWTGGGAQAPGTFSQGQYPTQGAMQQAGNAQAQWDVYNQQPYAQGGSGAGTSYQDYMNAARNLPPPSQMAPGAWNAMTPGQQQFTTGMYGQLGYDPKDVQSMFNQSLPKYSSGQGMASGGFRLV
jgi:hypothetical protein